MKDITTPIYYSSPTIQFQEISHLNSSDEFGFGGPETASLTPNIHRDQCLLVQEPSVSESFMQMEGTSNGKLEETREVQLQDEDKEVYIQDVGDSKPVDEFARDMDIADNSDPTHRREVKVEDFSEPADKSIVGKDDSGPKTSSRDEETEPAEKTAHQVVDSEQVVEEKEVLVSVIDSVDQPPADLEYSEERNEKLLPSMDDETGESSTSATNFPSKEINGKTLTPFDECNGFPPVVTDLASKASIENNNESSPAVAQVLPKGHEGTESQAGEESIGESSYETRRDTGGGECDKPEVTESTANQSIASVNGRPLQPTSWRSCCGLFEVLRRSDQ
ncbi:hypothetical protein FNV43_RR14665 [Rhamnella rubrinervis]|uniref:Uncharacterized protein n=1 Tax=Rhamnella rubrinervis TaxID=2594499 RepID=A0A8K0H3C4_9ROSA|nr:hypothetical protein FNV43_RR14665 [Rhamnella rubrinervis]